MILFIDILKRCETRKNEEKLHEERIPIRKIEEFVPTNVLVEHKFPDGDNERHRKINRNTVAFDVGEISTRNDKPGRILKPSNESIQVFLIAFSFFVSRF